MSRRSMLTVVFFAALALAATYAASMPDSMVESDCRPMQLCEVPIDGGTLCGVDDKGYMMPFQSECHMNAYSECIGRVYAPASPDGC